MRRCFVAASAVVISLSSPAWAQTNKPAAPSAAKPTAGDADVIAVSMWPTAAITLPEAQPTPASFALGRIEGVAPELLSGVTAKGYARKVSVENQTIGQILVLSVSKGGREETISTEGMTAQFDAKDSNQLFPEKTMEVQGSKSALISALQRLASPKKEEPKKDPPKDDATQNPTSGKGSANDVAAGYKSPTVSAAPVQEQKDPVTEMRVTSEGCTVRIDVAQGRAIKQSKDQTYTDGVLTNDGTCSDSEMAWPLKKNYAACPIDVVDLTAMRAWPQYSLYYTDDGAENHTVSDCAKDEETEYVVTEDEGQCPINIDIVAGTATPKAAMVYTNRNNALVQARGCENSTQTAPITMAENKAACPLRHDYGASLSYELSMWTYLRGGVTYQAAPCADTGRSFVQEAVYADLGGNYICTPVTNLTTKTVTLQSRKRITIDGAPQYITECTPDTSTKGIFPTTDGCMDPAQWTHDMNADISYGQERYWYAKADGSREYVTTCQTSAVTYPHSVTITGYQHHDDQLWSYPLSTVTITVNGSPYTIASSEVLPGSPQLVYVLLGTVDQATGTSSYTGCNAYRETARYERWQRPDGTEYLKQIGVGAPTGPVNVCVTNVIASQNMETGRYETLGGSCFSPNGGENNAPFFYTGIEYRKYYQTVNKLETKNTESGIVVSTTCGFANNASWKGTYTSTYGCGGNPNETYVQTLFVPPCPF